MTKEDLFGFRSKVGRKERERELMASPATKDHSHIDINDINEESQQISDKDIVEKDMAPLPGSSIHRSSSRPQLDVSGAAIQGNFEEKDPAILLPNQTDDISHLALDIGGKISCFLLES